MHVPAVTSVKGHAVIDAIDIYEKSRALGEKLGKLSDFVMIGESVPGGLLRLWEC